MTDIVELARKTYEEAARLNGHTGEDWAVLASVKETTLPWAQRLGKLYAEAIFSDPATRKVVEHLNRSDREQGLAVWMERLLSGQPGESFWADTCIIGFHHASTSVDNGHVLAMATRMEQLVLEESLKAFPAEQAREVFAAFCRVMGTATSLMIVSYEQAIIRGMTQLGLNERLLSRVRTVAIKKMIDEGRSSLPLLAWSDALSVGIAAVDEQHRKLIGLLNELHQSSAQGKGGETVRKVLGELVAYTASHFAFEEELLTKHGYPELPEHKAAHDKLAAEVVRFNDEFQAGRGQLTAELFMFLRSWLNGHIRGSDKAYGRFLIAKGLG